MVWIALSRLGVYRTSSEVFTSPGSLHLNVEALREVFWGQFRGAGAAGVEHIHKHEHEHEHIHEHIHEDMQEYEHEHDHEHIHEHEHELEHQYIQGHEYGASAD